MKGLYKKISRGHNIFKDPIKKVQLKHETRNNLFSYQRNKRLFIVGTILTVAPIFYMKRPDPWRLVSRFTGWFASLNLPQFVLLPILKMYISVYKINTDEILIEDLKEYKSISQFFIRKLKEGVRTIDEPNNPSSICSPCDGTVFNLGTCEENTLVIVKGHTYKVSEFLFGQNKFERKDFLDILDKIKKRGNEMKYILLYLSPSDYHRYHSPTSFTTSYRRHIPGTLYPVMPSFVKKKPEVFNANERVILLGDWIHGFFTTSFIGATNVGSIVVNFDKALKTNKSITDYKCQDENFIEMTDFDGIFKNNVIIKKNSLGKNEEDVVNILPECEMFDVKDMIDTNAGQTKFVYNESQEMDLKYNIINSFQPEEAQEQFDEYQKYLSEKLEKPGEYIQAFSRTNKGIMLKKGQEIGYFNMGSSIMLVFEAPKGSKFSVEEGQTVKLGNTLMKVE
ncbi:unnamed protein product [Moneuplotes crassus]|uniref:phosphatidylserine decarboxylase n=1 Tax=Euplotes crassus TaxID=5936 RepID=A0AAD1XEU6_EUPCR|nr:unnamed protein product [Moneuplotes crassus]